MLTAGAAKLDTTPHLGVALAGSFEARLAEDIHDPLHTRAVVLDDGETRIALVSCDLIVAPREDVDAAKSDIQERTGIPPERVMICGTHTHTGPDPCGLLGVDREAAYMLWVRRRLADVVVVAQRRLRAAKVGWGTGSAPEHVFNRRFRMKDGTVRMNPGIGNPDVVEPVGPTDPELGLLAILDGETDEPIACLGNYALHYVGGGSGLSVSADYFALMKQYITREIGGDFPVLWLNGCCGDVNNVDVKGPRPEFPPYGKMNQFVRDLTETVMDVWRGLSFSDDVKLAASLEDVTVARREIAADQVAEDRAYLAAHPDEGSREYVYARDRAILSEWPATEPAPVQAFRIGGLGIATLPGEFFAQYGLDIKADSPFAQTMVVELANSYVGYVPTVEAFDEGGYETWTARSSRLKPEAGPAMAGKASELLRRIGS